MLSNYVTSSRYVDRQYIIIAWC